MSGLTPGPWWVTDSGVRYRSGYIFHTKPAFHYPGQDERYEKEVAERNANKAAAAALPELLAFAEEFLADYQSEDGLTSMKYYAGKASAAIAKATGAQP